MQVASQSDVLENSDVVTRHGVIETYACWPRTNV